MQDIGYDICGCSLVASLSSVQLVVEVVPCSTRSRMHGHQDTVGKRSCGHDMRRNAMLPQRM